MNIVTVQQQFRWCMWSVKTVFSVHIIPIYNSNSVDGTYVYQIRREINNYCTKGNYKEVTISDMAIKNGLVYSINKGRPVPSHEMRMDIF